MSTAKPRQGLSFEELEARVSEAQAFAEAYGYNRLTGSDARWMLVFIDELRERALNAEAEVEGLEAQRAGDDLAIEMLRTENHGLRAAAMKLDGYWVSDTYDLEKNVVVREAAFAELRDLLGLKPKSYR
jgi:hypothetical protein